MRKINFLLLFVALILSNGLSAQNQYYPWTVGFSYAGVDYTHSRENFKLKNMNSAAQINAGRHIMYGASAIASAHLGTLRKPDYRFRNSVQFWNLMVGGQYSFANGYILPEDFVVEPYVMLTGGLHNEDKVTMPVGNLGFGLNYWVNDAMAINAQATFNRIFDKSAGLRSYDVYSVGLRWRLGAGKDTDQDGITDKEDKCPDVKGLPAFMGCPDSDGDGLEDAKDACPNESGKIIAPFNGCPDTDNDGILDKEDTCPNEAGTPEMKGCPDKDGDGIADKDDSCPALAGTKALNGCPDSDGDGIADKDDSCPMQKGTSAFRGCPES